MQSFFPLLWICQAASTSLSLGTAMQRKPGALENENAAEALGANAACAKALLFKLCYLTKWFVKPLLSLQQFSLLEETTLASSSWVVHRLQASRFTPWCHLQGHCGLGITSTAELENSFHILFQPQYSILGGGDSASE